MVVLYRDIAVDEGGEFGRCDSDMSKAGFNELAKRKRGPTLTGADE